MLIKKIIGTLILLLNIAGIGYLIYVGIRHVWDTYVAGRIKSAATAAKPVKKKKPAIVNDDIVLDEDDLLKDMDLSDLDDLDLEDFD
jgi:hypothetical protein